MALSNGQPPQRTLTWQEALEQVDVHALKFVFQSKTRRLKFLWFALFVGGFVAASFYIYKIILEFQSHPTATKVSTVEQDEYDYPPMYVCSRYSLDIEKFQKSNISLEEIAYLTSLIQKPDSKAAQKYLIDKNPESIPNLENRKFSTYVDFFKSMAFNFSQVVKETTVLDQNNFPVVFIANPTYDGEPITYRFCYELVLGKYHPNAGETVYLEYEMKEPPLSSIISSGFGSDYMVITHDSRIVLEKDRINLRRNRVTTIRLSAKKYIHLQSEENNCKSPDEIEKENYSSTYCRHRCYVQAIQTCHDCQVLTEDTPIDRISTNNLCSYFHTINQSIDCPRGKNLYHDCITKCRYPCEYLTYEYSLTLAVINHTHPNDDRITIWLYYEVDDGILIYEEIPTYTWAQMVSNIGGQLGLWTGASLLTGLELIYLLTHVWFVNWKEKKRLANKDGQQIPPKDVAVLSKEEEMNPSKRDSESHV